MEYKGLNIETRSELAKSKEKDSLIQRSIMIDAEIWEKLQREAFEAKTSASSILRALVQRWFDEQKI